MPADEKHIEIEGMDENGLFIRISRERFATQWFVHGSIHRKVDDDSEGGISNDFFYYDEVDPQSYFKAYHHLIEAMARNSKWIKERYNVGPNEGFPTKLHISSLRDGSLPSFQYSRDSDGLAIVNTKSSINSERNENADNGESDNRNGENA